MSYDPSIGRWISEDPIGFQAADPNLYRYVGNGATNATDPSGLWTWKIDPKGRILAVAEPKDTIDDLVGQGYGKAALAALGKKAGIANTTDALRGGEEIDLTDFFPKAVQQVLQQQQNLSSKNEVLQQVLVEGGAGKIPDGKTLGTSGVDLLQVETFDDNGRIVKRPLQNTVFGWGTCYGFVGLFLGQKPQKNEPLRNFALQAMKNEPFGYIGVNPYTKPGFYPVETSDKERHGIVGITVPDGGLENLLIGNRKPTKIPNFGAIALFRNPKTKLIVHAAIVLGKSRQGKAYVIQKLNYAEPYVICTTTHEKLGGGATPTAFYSTR